MRFANDTHRQMVNSGAWAKVGKKHYRHVSGVEVRYNCNRWLWEVVGANEGYTVLWAARSRAERLGLEQMPASTH